MVSARDIIPTPRRARGRTLLSLQEQVYDMRQYTHVGILAGKNSFTTVVFPFTTAYTVVFPFIPV
eukprot:5763513-Pyramimonas_sp.AAC.1